MSNQIDSIESYFDKIFDNLHIYRLPLHIASFMALSTFEDYLSVPIEKPVEISHLRYALGILMPQLFKHCHTVPIKGRDITSLRERELPYIYASEAMNFSQRYAWLAYHLTGHHQGWFLCRVEDRIIRFSPTPESDFSQSLMHHRLKQYHENMSKDNSSLKQIYRESPPEVVIKSLELALRHVNSEKLLNSIAPDVFETFRKIVLASSPGPTIERDIIFNEYSVQEYYDFWVNLSALMIAYLEACKVKYGRSQKRLRNSRILIMEPSEIADIVSKLGNISLDSSKNIVKDLVLDIQSRRPDIQVQPLVPTNARDLVLLSPHLIFTSNWEVCLLRNWARLSTSKYGEVVASKKVKLANQLATLLDGQNVKKAINKEVVNNKDTTIGDIDLAVFDSESGYLALIQLKWLIEPDSFQEESNVREELIKGIEQLRKCINLFATETDRFISNLFPQEDISPQDIKDPQFILMCRGSIDIPIDVKQHNINVLDYEISYDLLKKNRELPIRERFKRIVDLHSHIQEDIKEKACYNGIKIAGYLCQTPGLATSGQSTRNIRGGTESYSPNGPCFCGSGMRYRDCCKIIESLDEGDFNFKEVTDGSSS